MSEQTMRIAGESTKALPRRFAFTIKKLQSVTVPAGKDRIWVYDATTPNLAMMKTDKGAVGYYWVGKIDGRAIRYRLGGGELSLEQMRDKAIEVSAMRADGRNPQAEKQTARAEMTFGEMFEWFIEHHAKPKLRTWRELEKKYDYHLKELGTRRASSITLAEITRLHRHIGKTSPGSADRVLALISSVYNRARQIGYEGNNPAKGVERFGEHERERFLSPDELQRFMAAVEEDPTEFKDFFKLALWTGARSSNVRSMKWSELNLADGVWKIPGDKFKTGKDVMVPLVAPAIEVLKARKGNGSEYVFPSRSKEGYLQEPKKAWAELLKRAEISDLWIHDLRRTLASWMTVGGASEAIVGKTLGHRSSAATKRYARLNLDPVREHVNKAVSAMVATASKTKNATPAK